MQYSNKKRIKNVCNYHKGGLVYVSYLFKMPDVRLMAFILLLSNILAYI